MSQYLTNISQFVPHHDGENSWHRYGMKKLCHCHPTCWNCTQQQQQQQQPFYGPLSGTTQVSRYQKKHSPTHHP